MKVWNFYTNNNDSNKKDERNRYIIDKIIDSGIELVKNDLTEEQFLTWINYSKEMLDLSIENDNLNLIIKANYFDVLCSFNDLELKPYQKINYCIKYFIDILKDL